VQVSQVLLFLILVLAALDVSIADTIIHLIAYLCFIKMYDTHKHSVTFYNVHVL
jgi:hypothetical protein